MQNNNEVRVQNSDHDNRHRVFVGGGGYVFCQSSNNGNTKLYGYKVRCGNCKAPKRTHRSHRSMENKVMLANISKVVDGRFVRSCEIGIGKVGLEISGTIPAMLSGGIYRDHAPCVIEIKKL